MDFSNATAIIKQFSNGKHKYNQAAFISGIPGMGKTYAALNYCTQNKDSLYFSFKNIDSSFALCVFCETYPDVFGICSDWHGFFDKLKTFGKEKHPTVFFDNAGERNDKDEFYSELRLFLESNTDTAIIFIGRPWEQIEVPCNEYVLQPISTQEITDLFSVSDIDAVNIYCLTSGMPALLALYNTTLSFEENVNAMLNTNSVFYRLAIDWMRECFRTPETYNTLLYAMANGNNRVSELAKISGYPKNKCDKYIKALCEYGLVCKVPGKNSHTKYYPANSYLSLWYKALLTAVPNGDGSFDEEVYKRFMQHFSSVVLSDFYKSVCYYWVEQNLQSDFVERVDTKDEAYRDIKIGDITFGFVFNNRSHIYAYFDTVFGNNLNRKLWDEIEKVTTKDHPFYKNEYYVLTVNRVPDSYWKLSKNYDNVHIVSPKMLFSTFNEDYKKIKRPRFVPSFV